MPPQLEKLQGASLASSGANGPADWRASSSELSVIGRLVDTEIVSTSGIGQRSDEVSDWAKLAFEETPSETPRRAEYWLLDGGHAIAGSDNDQQQQRNEATGRVPAMN